MIDRTIDGSYHKLSYWMSLAEVLPIIPIFTGILIIANVPAIWYVGVLVILFGVLMAGISLAVRHYFNAQWDEIIDYSPTFAMVLMRYAQPTLPKDEEDEH